MAEEFFDACAHRLAFSAERFQLFVKLFDLLRQTVFFSAETLDELNGPEDTFLKAGKRIGFLIYVRHGDELGGRRRLQSSGRGSVLQSFRSLGDKRGKAGVIVVCHFGKDLAV